jgi:hypothetical protein
LWKRRSGDTERHNNPYASSHLLNHFGFSASTVGSTSVPIVIFEQAFAPQIRFPLIVISWRKEGNLSLIHCCRIKLLSDPFWGDSVVFHFLDGYPELMDLLFRSDRPVQLGRSELCMIGQVGSKGNWVHWGGPVFHPIKKGGEPTK